MTHRLSRALSCMTVLAAMLLIDIAPIQAAAIEEVIVTARKREESLQDVPVAIQALNATKIERYDADNLSEIADMANNVIIAGGTNGARNTAGGGN